MSDEPEQPNDDPYEVRVMIASNGESRIEKMPGPDIPLTPAEKDLVRWLARQEVAKGLRGQGQG